MKFFVENPNLVKKCIPVVVISSVLTVLGYFTSLSFYNNIVDRILAICIYVLLIMAINLYFIESCIKANRKAKSNEQALEELSAVYEELTITEEELRNQLDELNNQRKMLQEKDERYSLVVEASNVGIWDWDADTGKTYFSDKLYDIFELPKDALEEKDKRKELTAYILPEDFTYVNEECNKFIAKKDAFFESEYRIKTHNGKIKWINSVAKGLWSEDGKLNKIAGALSDITAKKETDKEIEKLAYFDSLTGLPSRSLLLEKFKALSAETNGNMVLIYIDIDSFKLINNSYGNAIGDKVLIEVANRLINSCTDKMYISRLGGDEYAILAWDYGSEDVLTKFMENLMDQIECPFKVNDYNINLSANTGIAKYSKNAADFDELLKNADTAMYNATVKRCKYLYYNEEMKDIVVERLQLMNDLKTALEHNEFLLYYQPQYWSRDKKIMGFEALVRWKSEAFGMVSPVKFISLAEESKLIIPLGYWIMEEAIKFIKRLHQQGYEDLVISVNISVVQLNQKNFAASVLKIIETYNIPPQSIELEITETAMMKSVDSVLDNVISLRSKGVRFALDDFGIGYSSLNYLTKLPINTLKIDKCFIENIGKAKEKSLITGSIVEIGRKLGLSIVAEGVETEEQYDYLTKKGCERIQGFLFSKPVPENEALKLIKQENKESA